jgi:peptidoglycan-associated lipoprotein
MGCGGRKTTKPTEGKAPEIVAPPSASTTSESTTQDPNINEKQVNNPKTPVRPPDPKTSLYSVNPNLKDVFFDYDQYELKPEARRALEENASWLKKNTQARIIIEGHTDERGTIEYNEVLGEKRAISAKSYLANLGIAADRIATISYGKLKPFNPEHTEEAWAENRRAHFKVSGESTSQTPTN